MAALAWTSAVPVSNPGPWKPPISEIPITGDWNATPVEGGDSGSSVRILHLGSTTGFAPAGGAADVCAHVLDERGQAVDGAVVTFRADAGAFHEERAATAGGGLACSLFHPPATPGTVVVSAQAEYGLLISPWVQKSIEVIGPAGTSPRSIDGGPIGVAVLLGFIGFLVLVAYGWQRMRTGRRAWDTQRRNPKRRPSASPALKRTHGRSGSRQPALPSRRAREPPLLESKKEGRSTPKASLPYVLMALGIALSLAGFAADYIGRAQAGEADGHAGHEEAFVGPRAPDVLALGISLLGVGVASLGLRSLLRKDLSTRLGVAKFAAIVLLLADGVIHLFSMTEHLTVVAVAAFFLATGIVQLSLPLIVAKRDRLLTWAGIGGSAALIAIFVYSRVLPSPFHDAPEPFEALGVLSKAIEATIIALLIYVSLRLEVVRPSPGASSS